VVRIEEGDLVMVGGVVAGAVGYAHAGIVGVLVVLLVYVLVSLYYAWVNGR
jgi:chromate transport protein ChrA